MTMTETVTTNPAPTPAAMAVVPAPQQPQPPAPTDAARGAFELAVRRAKVLSQSTLVPEAYRGPDGLANCLIALNLADRIGADPFAVIQNLDVIHGRPGLRATFLIATVNACQRFTPLRPRYDGAEGTDDWGCRAVARDKDTGEELVGARISIGMAKAEGWATKNGSKWRTMPEQMLAYRAAAFWTRLYAPELSLGIQTSEEVSDITGADMTPLPQSLTPASARLLEQELLGATPPAKAPQTVTQAPAAATPPAAPSAPAATVDTKAASEAGQVREAATPPAAKTGKGKAAAPLPQGDLLPAATAADGRLTPEQLAAGWEVSPDGDLVPPPARQPGED